MADGKGSVPGISLEGDAGEPNVPGFSLEGDVGEPGGDDFGTPVADGKGSVPGISLEGDAGEPDGFGTTVVDGKGSVPGSSIEGDVGKPGGDEFGVEPGGDDFGTTVADGKGSVPGISLEGDAGAPGGDDFGITVTNGKGSASVTPSSDPPDHAPCHTVYISHGSITAKETTTTLPLRLYTTMLRALGLGTASASDIYLTRADDVIRHDNMSDSFDVRPGDHVTLHHKARGGAPDDDDPMATVTDVFTQVLAPNVEEDDSDMIDATNHFEMRALRLTGERTTAWGSTASAYQVHQSLAWKGDESILDTGPNDVAIITVNTHGKTNPSRPNMKEDPDSRLPHLTSLVASGLADIVVCPECWLNDQGKRSVQTYLKTSGQCAQAFVAPTSECVSTMEQTPGELKISQSISGGVLILLSPSLGRRVTRVRNFCSGRILHITLMRDNGTALHILGVYGVSSPTQHDHKKALAREVYLVLKTLLEELGKDALIISGDLNTVWRATDRVSQKFETYDNNEWALPKLFQAFGMRDVHELRHPMRQGDYTFQPAGKDVSRIDMTWVNSILLHESSNTLRSAVASRPGPISSDHCAVATRITLVGLRQPGQTVNPASAYAIWAPPVRPRRLTPMDEKRQTRFQNNLDSSAAFWEACRGMTLSPLSHIMPIVRALTTLQADSWNPDPADITNLVQSVVQQDGDRGVNSLAGQASRKAEIEDARDTLLLAQAAGSLANLSDLRRKAHQAVTGLMTNMPTILNN